MTESVNFWAVVPAAGVGKECKRTDPNNIFLAGKTVLEHTLNCLLQADVFSALAVAISKEDPYWPELDCSRHEHIITAAGGQERADSVLSALKSLSAQAADNDWVLVHDAARPCLTVADIRQLINTLQQDEVGEFWHYLPTIHSKMWLLIASPKPSIEVSSGER